MTIDAARRDDEALGGADIGIDAYDQVGRYSIHNVRIARLAYTDDTPILNADVGLDDACHRVDDERIGNDQIQNAVGSSERAVAPRAGALGLAGAIYQLITAGAKITLDPSPQTGISQPDRIAHGWSVKLHIP